MDIQLERTIPRGGKECPYLPTLDPQPTPHSGGVHIRFRAFVSSQELEIAYERLVCSLANPTLLPSLVQSLLRLTVDEVCSHPSGLLQAPRPSAHQPPRPSREQTPRPSAQRPPRPSASNLLALPINEWNLSHPHALSLPIITQLSFSLAHTWPCESHTKG